MSRYTSAGDPNDDVENPDQTDADASSDAEYDSRVDSDDGGFVGDDSPEDGTSDHRDGEVVTAEASDDDSWWDEGLVGLLLVTGLALFLFPEPVTSGFGVALIAVGVAFWVLDWLA